MLSRRTEEKHCPITTIHAHEFAEKRIYDPPPSSTEKEKITESKNAIYFDVFILSLEKKSQNRVESVLRQKESHELPVAIYEMTKQKRKENPRKNNQKKDAVSFASGSNIPPKSTT